MRILLIAYALVNAIIYSALLPLWEGFDEPFHFGYVQRLANGEGLPDARTARLSREVYASLLLAPASQAVKQNLPQVTSYSEYFSWSAQRRSEVRRQLDAIPSNLRWQPPPSFRITKRTSRRWHIYSWRSPSGCWTMSRFQYE